MAGIWEQEQRWHLYQDQRLVGRVYLVGFAAGTPWCWAVWPPSGDGEQCGYHATREEAMAAVERVLGQEGA